MKEYLLRFISWLKGLSFRTGLIIAVLCALCYGASFGQMLLPISLPWKTGLWVAFFGLAKTFQYTALLILGKEGVRRIKVWLRSKTPTA